MESIETFLNSHTCSPLCAMLDLCAHAFQHGDHKICWFRRGEMDRIKSGRDRHRYSYHQYPSVHVNGIHFDHGF